MVMRISAFGFVDIYEQYFKCKTLSFMDLVLLMFLGLVLLMFLGLDLLGL